VKKKGKEERREEQKTRKGFENEGFGHQNS
jgi:hypothetical protein